MHPKAQRVAIAMAKGWKLVRAGRHPTTKKQSWHTVDPAGNIVASDYAGQLSLIHIPDYLNDANAAASLCDFMAERGWFCEVSNGLDKTWECEFYRKVTKDTKPYNCGTKPVLGDVEIHYHTALTLPAVISGCFLRALGLWKGRRS